MIEIIKIVKEGVMYTDRDAYKVNEVIEVSEEYADRLINEGSAIKADATQLEEWQGKQLGKIINKHIEWVRDIEASSNKFIIKLDNYMENIEEYYKNRPFFYDRSGIFWLWNYEANCYEICDEVDLMNHLDNILGFYGQTVNKNIKQNYIEAFKRYGRKKLPKPSKKKWIQFKDKAFSINSKNIHKVTPDYHFTNPIPWEIGGSVDTPVMDKLFEEWVGVKYMDTLFEIIAYCCYTDYPIQLIFCLYGMGRNGKSCFLRLLTKFIGLENICSTELDTLLTSRFETFKLYRKLVCSMGETNFGVLSKSSMLKKLVGGDSIGFEMKNKNPFDAYNYAKILIATNSLPTSMDTSEGFYRRWLIIDFPNQFPEGKDILNTIPDIEYNNLAKKITYILPKLIEKGTFLNQGNLNHRKLMYMMASNPITLFIDKCCFKGDEEFCSYSELYTAYVAYLRQNKKRRVLRKEFKSSLEDEGYFIERTSKKINDEEFKAGHWVCGLGLYVDWKDKIINS